MDERDRRQAADIILYSMHLSMLSSHNKSNDNMQSSANVLLWWSINVKTSRHVFRPLKACNFHACAQRNQVRISPHPGKDHSLNADIACSNVLAQGEGVEAIVGSPVLQARAIRACVGEVIFRGHVLRMLQRRPANTRSAV